jgi:hypothetical protein
VSRRRPAVVAVVAVVLAVSAGLAVPARGRAQPAGPALEVVLLSVSPAVGPGTPLGYRVEVRNHGEVPLRDLAVRARLGEPVATRSELAGLLANPDAAAGPTELDGFRPPAGEVAPGGRLRLPSRRVPLPAGLGAGSAGVVLPLSIRVQASSPAGPLEAGLVTFVVHLPERPARPLRTALLVPFHEPTHRNPAGELVDDRLAALVWGGGRGGGGGY